MFKDWYGLQERQTTHPMEMMFFFYSCKNKKSIGGFAMENTIYWIIKKKKKRTIYMNRIQTPHTGYVTRE